MKDSAKIMINITIYAIAVYLLMSAIYIFCHIDFGMPQDVVGPGFSEAENVMRMIMGLPKAYSTYNGVPPIYLVSSCVRLVLAVVMFVISIKLQIRWKETNNKN